VQLRKQAYQQLMASYEFNQGLLGFLLPHGEGVHTKARASVAAAVARLDLDKTTAVQQQQLAEQCVRRLFAGFCSAKALESTTVVSTLMQLPHGAAPLLWLLCAAPACCCLLIIRPGYKILLPPAPPRPSAVMLCLFTPTPTVYTV
jgi:hypothetical protein